MTISGILFDAAGVLYHRRQSTSARVADLLKERGLEAELPARERARRKSLRSQANKGQISAETYWDGLLQMHGVPTPEERRALIVQITEHSDQVLPVKGGRQALAGLKQRGFVLGIVTDTIYPIERKQRWLDEIGVSEYIDVLACSTTVGAHKPDPAIYLDALQQANLTPDMAAFVGHATDELWGARRAGLTTVAVYHDPDAQADYYAASLLELLDLPIFCQPTPQRHET